jgi:hypothetical protein
MFLVRAPRKNHPFQLQPSYGNTKGHIFFEEQPSHLFISDDEPIDHRAWTLQERLLSAWLIKYGSHATS